MRVANFKCFRKSRWALMKQIRRSYDTRASPVWVPLLRDPLPDEFEMDDPGIAGLPTFSPEFGRPTKTLLEYALMDPNVLTRAAAQCQVLCPDDPLLHPDYFQLADSVSVKELFEHRVHFGHKTGTLHAKMKEFLYGERLGVCIFDLELTAEYLRRALNFIAHMVYRGGIVLFASMDRMNMRLIVDTARECKEYSHTRRWHPGTFTNSLPNFETEIRLPDLILMTSTQTTVFEEHPVVLEASKMVIPIVGVVDSNCDPSLITYPIPGNDDSRHSVQLYLRLFKEAILKGKKKRVEDFGGDIVGDVSGEMAEIVAVELPEGMQGSKSGERDKVDGDISGEMVKSVDVEASRSWEGEMEERDRESVGGEKKEGIDEEGEERKEEKEEIIEKISEEKEDSTNIHDKLLELLKK